MKVVSADTPLQHTRRDASVTRDNDVNDDDAISVVDAYAILERDKQWKRMSVQIVVAITNFAFFLTMLFSHIPATDTLFQLGSAVSSTLAPSGVGTITADSSMKFSNIETIGDTFDWLTDTFVPSVFVTQDYNGNALAKDKWGRVAMFNKVLGGVVFNTTRAQIHPCQAEQFLVDLYPNCYDANTVTTESVLISFDTNATEATSVVQRLKARGDWLDFATQSLTITVVMYNGELQAYAVTQLLVTFRQGGSVEPSFSTTPVLSDPYMDEAAAMFDIIVGLSVVLAVYQSGYRLVRRLRRERALRSQARRQHEQGAARMQWSYLYLIQDELLATEMLCVGCTVLFYAVLLRIVLLMSDHTFRDNLARLVVSGKKFDVNSVERNGLLAVTDSLNAIATLTTALRVLAVVAILLHGLMVLHRFHHHPQLGVLTRTIARTLNQFSSVVIVFAVVFVTYAAAGTVLFGDRVEGFSSLARALETCVNMLFGSFDYTSIQDVYVPAPMLFYWSYMVIVSLVLLNMMLAIVLDAYANVSAAQSSQRAVNASMVRVVDNIRSDLADAAALPYWLKRALRGSTQSQRSLRALHDVAIAAAPPLHALALCQDLDAEDVISHGRIRTRILRKLLRYLHEARGTEPSGSTATSSNSKGPSSAVVVPSIVTAKTLIEWFHSAQLSDAVAHATIAYIRDGMTRCVDEPDASTSAAAADPVRRVDAKCESEASCQCDHRQQVIAPVSSPQDPTRSTEDMTAAATVSSQVAHLLEKVDAMQQKLDVLLRQLPTTGT